MESQKVSEKIKKAFNKIVIKECTICGSFITDTQFKDGEGACAKCWDSGEDYQVNK